MRGAAFGGADGCPNSRGTAQRVHGNLVASELRLTHLDHELEEARKRITAYADFVHPSHDLAFAVCANHSRVEREQRRALQIDAERDDWRSLRAGRRTDVRHGRLGRFE